MDHSILLLATTESILTRLGVGAGASIVGVILIVIGLAIFVGAFLAD